MADSAGAMQRRGLVDGPDFEFFQRRYFTPAEVAEHNLPEDLWVSYLGSVYDLTPLAQEHKGDLLLKPIIEVAGQDISHWFDPKTRDIRKHVDPLTGTLRYRTPRGRFLHVPPQLPRSDWANDFGKPWWQGTRYEVGRLSAKTRSIRIINTLTSQEHTLETEREKQRHRRREKQAPCQEPDMGLDPGTPGSRPRPKAGAKPLRHPGIPDGVFSTDAHN
ncbi:cytochrome b5 domain-containing protein 1 isoform X2 [Canis lupus familiaris]|uniref:cytochrome b5 domain-containing protein 1 isoform X2 n=1 Tax=Canis lupus familiaris TaxID=9615 RepID=UPI000BAA084B|nr:cytochrome b5 domain-containing protein 1 isoform X2 [Canis lupus familiaris]XP_038392693.1 cytochrome b5 domain-containing protein 1 isoform X2 [Canis lupus familiaris]XP_038521413.1 cytochrome b5 domain-containing protein 1 isoform X2 [Canis lupus familiaris]|eukprot:XP_005620058.2 cytochrome b5 domain-containing protein 1 isoform X1 [Canis lupus familiaris]